MKNKIYFALLVFTLTLVACKKEYPTPTSSSSCTINYQNHSKNTTYQTLLDEHTNSGMIGLSVLTESPDQGIWMGASGYAQIEEGTKMTSCHLQHTASIYKTFIAVVIMQLAEEGHFNLDDKAADHLPDDIMSKMPNGDKFTIRNMLQHRTGMVDAFEIDFLMDFFDNPYRLYTVEELLTYLHKTKAQSEPNTGFYYSDGNYLLLALLANKYANNYETAIRSRIIEPLGLNDTYYITEPEEAPNGLADSYWDRFGDGKFENNSDIQIALTAGLRGTDGIISTTADLNTFIRALFDGTLISQASISEMSGIRDVPDTEQQKHGIVGYGLGMMQVYIGDKIWHGHFGNHVGSGAALLYCPETDQSIVAYTNTGTFFSKDIKPIFFGSFLHRLEYILSE